MPLLTAVLATQAPTDVAGAGHGRNLAEYYKFECRRAKRLITLNIGVFVDDLFCDTYEKTHSSCDEGARALLNKVSDIYQGQLNMRFAAAWVSGAPTDCRSTGGMHDWVRMQLPGLAQQAAFIKLSGCRWDLRGNILPAGRASIGALPSGRAGHRPNNTGAALCHGHTDDVYNVAHELGHIVGFNHYHGWNNAQYGIMDYHNSGLLQDGGVDAKYNGAVQFSPNSPHRDVQVVCNALQSLENNNPSYIVLGAVSTQDPTPPKIIGNEPLVSYDYETKSSMGTRCKIHNNHGSTDYPVNEVAARCKAHCDKNADCVAYSYRDDWGYCHSYTAFKGTETDAAAYTGCFVKLAEKNSKTSSSSSSNSKTISSSSTSSIPSTISSTSSKPSTISSTSSKPSTISSTSSKTSTISSSSRRSSTSGDSKTSNSDARWLQKNRGKRLQSECYLFRRKHC